MLAEASVRRATHPSPTNNLRRVLRRPPSRSSARRAPSLPSRGSAQCPPIRQAPVAANPPRWGCLAEASVRLNANPLPKPSSVTHPQSRRPDLVMPLYSPKAGLILPEPKEMSAEGGSGCTLRFFTPEVAKLLSVPEGETPRGELSAALGMRDREHFRQAILPPALRAEVIERTQPDSPKSSKQRYRLTTL